MFRPIFRMFRYLMCVNHQGEFDLKKYRSKPKYEEMPSDPTFYMSPDEATQFNTLSLKQKEEWDNSQHWEDLREEKITTSSWFRDWRVHLGNQKLYRNIRDNWVKHGESHVQFYARLKSVLLKPPEDTEVAASSSQPPRDGGPGSGGVKTVTQLTITRMASGRQVSEKTDKKEDPSDKSDKPDQQEPPEQQSESKSAEKPPPTPPPCEIVSKSPSVSGQSEQAGQSDAEMASTEVNSAKSRSARSTESEASQPATRDPSPFRTAPCVDSPSISEGVLETAGTDDRLSEIIGAFSSMQENLEEAFANG
ncbi:MAG: hypothetical protein GY820_01785, partial [Gammaproteobacteria bacterium]|nr:hypothetical protein [Gammaproteobacteria bacterium]